MARLSGRVFADTYPMQSEVRREGGHSETLPLASLDIPSRYLENNQHSKLIYVLFLLFTYTIQSKITYQLDSRVYKHASLLRIGCNARKVGRPCPSTHAECYF